MSTPSFWLELKRRKVVRVGAAYVVGASAVGAVASDFLSGLGAPGWVLPTVLWSLILGLPVALMLAWVYDLTPSGLSRTVAERALDSSGPRPIAFSAHAHTVGRTEVMDVLRATLDDVPETGGKVVCVTGEPGIGKTTLAQNFVSELAPEDYTVAHGRCSERLAGAEAYLPFFEALDSLLRADDSGAVRDLLRGTAPSWYAELGNPGLDDSDSDLPVDRSQERMKRELVLFLERLTRDRPLVLFVEDLHWADVSTIDVLTYVADRFDRIGAMVLVTYRPEDMRRVEHAFLEVQPTLRQRGTLHEIPLGFLGVEDVRQYVKLELGDCDPPEGLAELIHEKTEGSPLFMVDLVRELRRREVLVEREGRVVLDQSLEAIGRELPESIRSMIGRKIEQLAAEEREILLAGSVQGEEFDGSVIAGALGLDAAEVEERLEGVRKVHAMIGRGREKEFPDGTVTLRYRFVHVLYQNELYALLTPARRVASSLSVARAIERHHPSDGAGVATELAFLYEEGRDAERAAAHFLAAARHASTVFARQETARLAQRGIRMLGSMPEDAQRARTELAFRALLAPAIMEVSGWASPEAAENNRRLEELSRAVGDDLEVFATLCGSIAFHLVAARPADAVRPGQEGIELATSRDEGPLLVTAHAAFGDVLFLLGDFERARDHQSLAVDRWRRGGWEEFPVFYAQHPLITALGTGAWTLASLGLPEQALAAAHEGVRVAPDLGHPFSVPFAYSCLANLLAQLGDVDGLRQATAALRETDEVHAPYFEIEALWMEGAALGRSGFPAEALPKLRDALAMFDDGFPIFRTRVIPWVAEMSAELGQVDEALDLIEDGLGSVENGGVRAYLSSLHRAKGDLLGRPGGDASEAEQSYRTALEVARGQAARGLELQAALGLSELLGHQGRHDEARAILEPLFDGFTEGSESPDLRRARDLL